MSKAQEAAVKDSVDAWWSQKVKESACKQCTPEYMAWAEVQKLKTVISKADASLAAGFDDNAISWLRSTQK
jgi:hypothetical protein